MGIKKIELAGNTSVDFFRGTGSVMITQEDGDRTDLIYLNGSTFRKFIMAYMEVMLNHEKEEV